MISGDGESADELRMPKLRPTPLGGSHAVTLAGVEKHTQRIFAKLGLLPDDDAAHRRVAAVLQFLRQGS